MGCVLHARVSYMPLNAGIFDIFDLRFARMKQALCIVLRYTTAEHYFGFYLQAFRLAGQRLDYLVLMVKKA